MKEFIDGAEAIVRGAIAAGCNFFAGYPITPATPILHRMIAEVPRIGGVAVQAEDEIASIGMCIGAAMVGAKAMTATSGPGISLCSENIGLAIMGEVPLVIVDVMRLGPATGGATTVGQGDVQFAEWGTSGGYPNIVLCPSNPRECYSFTTKAFQLAARFRSPVFLLTDREVVATMSTVEMETYTANSVCPHLEFTGNLDAGEPFIPYHVDKVDDVPAFSPYGGPNLVRFTGSTHDEHGFLTKNPKKVARLNQHLAEKIDAHRDEIELVTSDLQSKAKTLIVSYGVTARSMLEAIAAKRHENGKVSGLIVHSLWPVPESAIYHAMQGVERVVVAELNLGQYRRELERLLSFLPRSDKRPEIVGVNRVDGELITPQEMLEKVL